MEYQGKLLGLAALFAAAIAFPLDTQPGQDPGRGIPVCGDSAGWFSLFDGTQEALDTYWWKSDASHGDGGKWWVENGILYSDQNPGGQGGLLYTKSKYSNMEVKVDIHPDWGNDGGMFFHSNGRGSAYQVVIDYKKGKTVGGVWGERIYSINYKPFFLESETEINVNFWEETTPWTEIWDPDGFNELHARITEGNPPRIRNFINGYESVNWKAPQKASELDDDGYFGLQIHGGTGSWEGGANQYKSVKVRELKASGEPMDSPEWSEACITSTKPAGAGAGASRLRAGMSGGGLRVSGRAAANYALTVTDVSGRELFRTQGGPGRFDHEVPLTGEGLRFIAVRGPGFRQTAKFSAAGPSTTRP